MDDAPKRSFTTRLWHEWVRPLMVVLIVVGSMRSAFADWNDVPTGSMLPTIVPGDRVVVNKAAWDLRIPFTLKRIAQWGDPEPGDIIVFFSPADEQRLVKRVIAGPGQIVELRDGVVMVDGTAEHLSPLAPSDPRTHFVETDQLPLVSDAAGPDHVVLMSERHPSVRDFGPVVIPDDAYFVMGDNRDQSYDSRFFGAITRDRIVGKAVAVAFSLDRGRYFIPRLDRWFEAVR